MNWPLLLEGQFRKTPKILQNGQTGQKRGGQFRSAAKIRSLANKVAKFRNLAKFRRVAKFHSLYEIARILLLLICCSSSSAF